MSQFSKQEVAVSFSRAAESYDSYAKLQQQVGEYLLGCIKPQSEVQQVIDLGCGTGFFVPHLLEKLTPVRLTGVDLAPGMLAYAREHRVSQFPCQLNWLCADAEALPFADNSVNLAFSSLAIQWCENLPRLFGEMYRVLRPGGQFVFSTLGPDSLSELRQSWAAVDNYQHVSEFVPFERLQSCFGDLITEHFEQQHIQLQYSRLKDLTNELKRIGAHNMSSGRQESLTGKQHLMAFKQAYEGFRNEDDKLPATYQVAFAVLTKPA